MLNYQRVLDLLDLKKKKKQENREVKSPSTTLSAPIYIIPFVFNYTIELWCLMGRIPSPVHMSYTAQRGPGLAIYGGMICISTLYCSLLLSYVHLFSAVFHTNKNIHDQFVHLLSNVANCQITSNHHVFFEHSRNNLGINRINIQVNKYPINIP